MHQSFDRKGRAHLLEQKQKASGVSPFF